jgi:hypothetical protein
MEASKEIELCARIWVHYKHNPVDFCNDMLNVELDPCQQDILNSIADDDVDLLFVESCHGAGKTLGVACSILWFGFCQFHAVRIPCTAPKIDTIKDKLWPELHKIIRGAEPIIRHSLEYQKTKLQFFDQAEWYAKAETAREPEGAAGHHEKKVLCCVEEAMGVSEEFWPVIMGALSTEGSKGLFVTNPTRNTGYFARAKRKKVKGVKIIRMGWSEGGDTTKPEIVLTDKGVPITVWKTDRPDANWARMMIDNYGRDSNTCRIRLWGMPPKAESDSLVSSDDVWAAYGREPTEQDRLLGQVVWGWDVAGDGEDKSCRVERKGDWVRSISYEAPDLLESTGIAAEQINSERPSRVNVDSIGIGEAPVLLLRSKGLRVTAVNVGESQEPEKRKDKATFMNKRAQYYWRLREGFKNKTICLDKSIPESVIDDLAEELEATKWFHTPQMHKQIVPKERIKEQLGRSPDTAEGLMLTESRKAVNVGDIETVGTLMSAEG